MSLLGVVALLILVGTSVSAEQSLSQKAGSRIVSGWEARDGQFPYMLYLRSVDVHGRISACGGSIIHHKWGMTSARCIARRVVIMLWAGMVDLSRPRVYIETASYFTAPEYMDDLHQLTQPHDIGLVGFNRHLEYSQFIQPIRLMRSADMNKEYAGVKMTTSGWGTDWTNGNPTQILNFVYLRGVNNFVCALWLQSSFHVRESTICAGPYNVTSQGICSGDSGVPLTLLEEDGQLTQVGVGSFVSSFGCHVGLPNAFVRPGHYHDWIRAVTGIQFDW